MNPTAPLSGPIASLEVASDTIEDFVHSYQPPIDPAVAGARFAVVQAGSSADLRTELLTVDPKGRLLHVHRRDGVGAEAVGAADSGWQSDAVDVPDSRPRVRPDPLPSRGGIVEIAAFGTRASTFAFVHYQPAGGARHVEPLCLDHEGDAKSRGWRLADVPDQVRNAVSSGAHNGVFELPDGRRCLYGVSTNFDRPTFYLLFPHDGDAWRVYAVEIAGTTADTRYRLLPPTDEQHQFTCMRIDGARVRFQQGRLVERPGRDPRLEIPAEGWQEKDLRALLGAISPADLAGARLHAVPGEAAFLVEAAGQLFHVTDYATATPRCTRLTGADAQPAAVSTVTVARTVDGGGEPLAVIAAIERGTGALWLDRLHSASSASSAAWSSLGGRADVLGCPAFVRGGLELYAVRDGGAGGPVIEHLAQSPAAELWHTTRVAASRAGGPATAATTHTSSLRLRDAAGRPVSGHREDRERQIAISSSHSVTAIVNGVSRKLDPGAPIRVMPDGDGEIAIAIAADSVNAPELTVEMPDGKRSSFRPDDGVKRRLAGGDPRFPVTAERLRAAGLLPGRDRMPDAKGDEVAKLMRAAGSARLGEPGGLELDERGDVEVFSFDFGAGHSELAIAHHRAPASPSPAFAPSSSIGDFFEWLRSQAVALGHWAIEVGRRSIEFIVTLGKEVHRLVASTFEQVGRAFEALFASIGRFFALAGDAAGKLLHFLRALFDWKDIGRAAALVDHVMQYGLHVVERAIGGELVDFVREQLKTRGAVIDQSLVDLRKHVEGMSLRGIEQGKLPGEQGDAAGEARALYANHSVQLNYVSACVKANRAAVDAPPSDASLDSDPELKSLMSLLESAGRGDLREAVLQVAGTFKSPPSPGELLEKGLLALIDLARPLIRMIVNAVDTVVTAILRFTARAIGMLRELLATALPIPVVSDAWRAATGGELTWGSLIALLFAAPTTIIYKLAKQNQPLVTQAQLDEVRLHMPLPNGGAALADADSSESGGVADEVRLLRYFVRLHLGLLGDERHDAMKLVEKHLWKLSWLPKLGYYCSLLKDVDGMGVVSTLTASRDSANAAVWTSGRPFSIMNFLNSVGRACLSMPSVWNSMFKDLVVRLLPKSPEAERIRASKIYYSALPEFLGMVAQLAITLTGVAASVIWPEPVSGAIIGAFCTVAYGAVGFVMGIWFCAGILPSGAPATTIVRACMDLIDPLPWLLNFFIALCAAMPPDGPIKAVLVAIAGVVVVIDFTTPLGTNLIRMATRLFDGEPRAAEALSLA